MAKSAESLEKRYYWLKFREDFFASKRIKKLRKMAGGDTYVIIYLKMQLKALRTDGILEFTGVEENFADELALDIDENPDDVRMLLAFLMTYGLCECSDNIHYMLPYVLENTGSETAGAQRLREYRAKQKALQCNYNVQDMKQLGNADETSLKRVGNAEKEIEKELEIEIDSKPLYIPPSQGEDTVTTDHREDKPKKRGAKQFIPPTLDEIKEYVAERGLCVDPNQFYEYFTTPNENGKTWIDSKGNPVLNWKQKILTWNRYNGGASIKKPPAELPEESSTGFTDFCKEYPSVEERRATYEAYLERMNEGYSSDDLIGAAKAYARKCRLERIKGRYVKSSKRFLDAGGMFTDYIPKEPEIKTEQSRNPYAEYDVEILRVGV